VLRPNNQLMRRLGFLPLVAATYFMVSGGPYGIEDAIGQAGYAWTLLLLVLVPFCWSLPTALMVGELASALPEEGGFYVWVTRGLGPFWGFQEAWLSMAASIFDMALYPALTVSYLAQLSPGLATGHRGMAWRLGIIIVCAAWNLRGASAVGRGSLWLSVLLLVPFVVLAWLGLLHAATHPLSSTTWLTSAGGSFKTALLVLLWNYMGWDNASTIAREVERPQQTYARAMLASVCLVSATYVVSTIGAALGGVPASHLATGDWVVAARLLANGGSFSEALADAIVIGGALTGIAMFNALTLSYARVPTAMASDGFLPNALTRHNRYGVPYVAVLTCCAAWASVSGFSFERLVELDISLYGLSLILEFAALVALRIRQPNLPRPYRIPGQFAGVLLTSCPPLAIVVWAILASRHEQVVFGSMNISVLFFVGLLVGAGMLIYLLARPRKLRLAQPKTI
jgi:amino acid transporter